MKKVAYFLVFGCLLHGGAHASANLNQIIVGRDDTVYGIAYKYGINTQKLIAANNLVAPFVLREGQVLIIPSPNEHVVGGGETLQSVADTYGVKVDVLAQENTHAQSLKPGDKLLIPPRDTESITEALKPPAENIKTSSLDPLPLIKIAPPNEKTSAGVQVQPISSNSSNEDSPPKKLRPIPDELADELAQEKGTRGTAIASAEADYRPPIMGNLSESKAGSSIVPKDLPNRPLSVASSNDAIPSEEKPKKKIKKQEENTSTKKVKDEKTKKKRPDKKEEEKVEEAIFIWPVEYKDNIRKFSNNVKNKNDGINIKVPEGTSVKVAADGIVMYAGNELKGFGNLLLIKHENGWVTAYAHNSKLLVQKGEAVKQGQTIAKSGKTGDVKEAQLHFEIRKGKQPVDPLPLLGS